MEGSKETYAVRVLNLTHDVEDSLVLRAFNHFGPVDRVDMVGYGKKGKLGFIHFYSKEVAEVAANEMDGTIINGIRIKTSFRDPERKENDTKNIATEDGVLEQNSLGECFNPAGHGSNHLNRKDTGKMNLTNTASKNKQTSTAFPPSMARSGATSLMRQIEQLAPQRIPQEDAEQRFIGIYWDIENCQLSSKIEPRLFVEKIRSKFLQGKKKLEEFLCCCDNTKIRKSVIDGLSKAEVDVLHVSATAKNAADDKLKLQMHKFGYKYKNQATVILISGDVNFVPVLNQLRYSLGAQVILLHNVQASSDLTNLATESFCFERFISDLPTNTTTGVENAVVQTTELLVTNLPSDPSFMQMVRTRLSILSDNCGGRVGTVQPDLATRSASCVISFASASDADRALVRMEGGDVCGKTIHVEHYWGIDQSKASKEGPACTISYAIPENQKQQPRKTDLQKSDSLNALPGSSGRKHFQKADQISRKPLLFPPNMTVPTVKHPSQMQGQFSTNKLKNQQVNESRKEQTISDKVKYTLRDFPYWLSFERFIVKFKENYKEAFEVRQFSELRNVLVDGKPGKMFVYLTDSSVSSIPVNIEQSDFEEMLISILEMHKRAVQISALPGLMWSYNKKILRYDSWGTPICELIENCPNVTSRNSTIFLSERSYDPRRNMERFVHDTLQLLSFAKNWTCPVQSFPAAFQRFFGTNINGISNFEQLLADVSGGILEVLQKNGNRYLTVAVQKRKEILGQELICLLAAEKKHWLPINSLPAKYYAFYGRKMSCKEDLRSLLDLINAIKGQGFRIFQGKDKVLCFGLKKVPGQSFNNFKRGLIKLLCSKHENKVLLESLEHEYREFHGDCPQLMNLGFDHPNALFAALMPDIVVKKSGNDVYIVLCQSNSLSLWEDILRFVFESSEKYVLLRNLPQAIQDRSDALFSSVPPFITVLGSGETVCFIATERYKELVTEDAGSSICKILYGSPGYKLHFQEVCDKLEGIDVQRDATWRMALSSGRLSVQGETVILCKKAALRYFAFEVLALLYELPDQSCKLDKLCAFYHKKFGKQYKVADFGFKKAVDVFNAIAPDMIQATPSSSAKSCGNAIVLSPSPNGRFIEEARRLLIESNGLVFMKDLATLFKRISPAYERLPDISEILESYPELFAILNFKSTTAEDNLVLWKHFSISLEAGYKGAIKEIKTKEKLPLQMQNVKSEADEGDLSDGHYISGVKSSTDGGSADLDKTAAAEKQRSKRKGKRKKPVPTLDRIPDDVVIDSDLSNCQKSSYSDSSDSASVIIEDEGLVDLDSELVGVSEFIDEKTSSLSANEVDLLSFGGTDSESDMDWWTQGVPDHLPSPAIRPEPITFERDDMVGDLISLQDDSDDSEGGSENEHYNLSTLDDPGSEIHSDLHGLQIQ